MTLTFRHKLQAIGLVSLFFLVVAILVGLVYDVAMELVMPTGFFTGFVIACFEEFYFHGRAGIWMRRLRPVIAIPIYAGIACILFLIVQHATYFLTGNLDQLVAAYARYHISMPVLFVATSIGILGLRIISFIGGGTLINLLTGRYIRPIVERKILLFLDMKGSTEMVEALGAVQAKAYIGKFLFDISRPVTEYGGDIYLYTGDGLIGMWDWENGVTNNRIVAAVDAINQAVEREKDVYLQEFGRLPEFRIGVHGGDVVISEQGDTKRSIGVYGETINIAARMEQKAKEIGVGCLFSTIVVDALKNQTSGFEIMGEVSVRGISHTIEIQSYIGSPGNGR